MDIEKLIEAVRLCGSTPKVDQCKRCAYWFSGDMDKCIPKMTRDAADTITELLDRAEKAERKIDEALEEICRAPAADVEPAVRGEWIDSPDGTTTICSYCKADWNAFDNDTYRFNYCPNCGAKMDLEG